MDRRAVAEEIGRAVRARCAAAAAASGGDEVALDRLVAEEVERLLPASLTPPVEVPLGPAVARAAAPARPRDAGGRERLVVSASGHNRSGIVAGLTAAIAGLGGDISDISQTLVGELFNMLIVVDFAATSDRSVAEITATLVGCGSDLGVHVVALHERLLAAMHTV